MGYKLEVIGWRSKAIPPKAGDGTCRSILRVPKIAEEEGIPSETVYEGIGFEWKGESKTRKA